MICQSALFNVIKLVLFGNIDVSKIKKLKKVCFDV